VNRQYYYLISSLVELFFENQKKPLTTDNLLDLCSEEMDPDDYNNLKKLFLFNDIRNAVNHNKKEYRYLTPAYYNEEEFKENLNDTDSFLPFLAEYFSNKKGDKRLFPDLMEIDEIVLLFYIHLDEITNTFVKDYYLFELDLQNITTALSLRKNNISYQNKIIPYGDNYKHILKSNSPDFGISREFPGIEQLVDVYKHDDLIKIETTIEELRWKWLDDRTSLDNFGSSVIYSYAVKLNSLERWVNMTDQKGQEVIERLIDNIKSKVIFNEEFSKGGR